MNNTDTEKVIRKIARERKYEGDLTDAAVAACAKVYESCIGKGGALSPKKYMRAPNGKPTKLTEMQWLLTRTPAFKRWFGDSMVKDENGDPQVMYHGTKDDFASFRLDFIGMRKSAMTLWAGAGFYFSDGRKEAEIYAKKGGVVKEVFLRLERPLVVDETGNAETWGDHVTRDEAVAIMMDGDNTHWMDVELPKLLAEQDFIATGKSGNAARYKEMKRRERVKNFVKRMKTDVVKLKAAALAYGSRSQRKFLDSIMKHTNHDGIIHRIAPGVTEWVVYDPTAIKSATDNNGEYSDKKTAVADAADDGMNKVVDALKGFGKGFEGSGQGSNRHNMDESANGSGKTKGTDDMATAKGKGNGFFNRLISSLKGLVPEEVAMDIVDRNGRHHQPKAIPEGGQFEEEGQYLSGSAKIEHAIRNAGRGKHGKIMREYVAPLYKRIGVDSVTRAKLQKMHEEIRDLPKQTLQRRQVEMFKQMKKSAEDYEAVRNMSKEEFQAWYDNHPEYHNEIADRLLSKGRYKAHFGVHGGYHDDGSGVQKHAAWEEAKWGVGAKVVTALMQFQEYSDAINGVPDQVMEAAIERAESAPEIAPAAVREDIVVGGGREGVGEQGTGAAVTPAPAETATAPAATAPAGSSEATPAPAASGSTAATPNGNGQLQRAENYFNGLNDSTKDRLRTEVANSSGTDFETAHHEAEQNASASASSLGNQSINRGTVYTGVMAKGLAWQKVGDLRRQKAEAEARGDTAAAEDLENQAVRAENAARAIGNFLARANLRDENGNFVTKEAMARNMIESYRAAWQRSMERHPDDYEAVANSRGVTGQEDAILAMGEILGFTPDFLGAGTVEMRWNGGGTTQGVAEQATPAASERVATPSAAPEATATPQTAETPTEAAQTAPTDGTAEGGVREPTEEEWNDFVTTIVERTPYTRNEVESFIRDLRNGGELPQDNRERVNGLRTALADHPVMQYLEARGNLGATPQAAQTPVAPTPSETPAAPTPAAAQPAPESTPAPAPANADGGGFTPTDAQFRAIAGQRAGGFTRRSIETVLNGETFTDEDGAITPAEMAQRLRSYQGTEGDLRNQIADEIERRNNLPNTRQQQATPAAAQEPPAGGAQTQGAQAFRIPTPQDINANTELRGERTASGANAYPGLLLDPDLNHGMYSPMNQTQRSRLQLMRGVSYDWPVRGRNARITADQITPELATDVASNLATGRRASGHTHMALQYLRALANPAAMDRDYAGLLSVVEGWNNSRNINNRRFRQMFDALHPGYFEHRAEMRRQAELNANRERLRREAQNFVTAGQQVNNDGPLREGVAQRVNFTEADATDAVNRMAQAIGEEYRPQIQQAMTAFQRNGVIPANAQNYINRTLPADHPVRRAITEAEQRVAIEKNRVKEVADVDSATSNRLADIASKTGVAYRPGALATDGRGGSHGYNCYLAALVYGMRRAGLDVPIKNRPSGYGEDSQKYFIPLKMAMESAGWEKLNGRTREETIQNLERLAKTKPNDYTLELWDGNHHGTSAFLRDGKWYHYDVFHDIYSGPLTSAEIAPYIQTHPEGSNSASLDPKQERLARIAIRDGIPLEQRHRMTREQINELVDRKMKESRKYAESSYGHMPGDYTEDLIREALRD